MTGQEHFEAKVNSAENFLSTVSAWPIIGTLAGVIKIGLGVTQTLTAVATGIFTSLYDGATKGNWEPAKHSIVHVEHGIGNIVGGLFESIPIVQTGIYAARRFRMLSASDTAQASEHKFKFLPYQSLVKTEKKDSW